MELYRILDLNIRLSRLNKRFELLNEFKISHDKLVSGRNPRYYFNLSEQINVKRKDQLLLSLQYNKLLHSYNLYSYEDYYRCTEEFFTYFLNYEMTTLYCSPSFPQIITSIFDILNKYNT